MYNFTPVICNSNPVGATNAGGSLLPPAALAVISAKTSFLDQVKINSISELINYIFKVLQKLLKCFGGITTLVSFFASFVSIINSFTITNTISVFCNTCLLFQRFRNRTKTITWFISVMIPQTIYCCIFAVFKQIAHSHYKI